MKSKQYIISIIIYFLFGSCDKIKFGDYGITIKIENNYNEDIYYSIAGLDGVSIYYPDTSLPEQRPSLNKIEPGKYSVPFLRALKSKDYFDELPADTVSIFILSSDVYENTPWEEIRQNYMILKRYDMSEQDLEQADWTISYP